MFAIHQRPALTALRQRFDNLPIFSGERFAGKMIAK